MTFFFLLAIHDLDINALKFSVTLQVLEKRMYADINYYLFLVIKLKGTLTILRCSCVRFWLW